MQAFLLQEAEWWGGNNATLSAKLSRNPAVAWPFKEHVTLGQSFPNSGPQFPCLYNVRGQSSFVYGDFRL